MSGFCINYLKIISLTGFIVLALFSLLIFYDVETIKIKKENKNNGVWITAVTSGIYFLGFLALTIIIRNQERKNEELNNNSYRLLNLQDINTGKSINQ